MSLLKWMAWTPPIAIFFICIGLLLIAMTVWELRSPTVARRGLLPLVTTRGDRLFIGLLAAAGSLTLIPGAVVIYFVRNYIAKGFALGRV